MRGVGPTRKLWDTPRGEDVSPSSSLRSDELKQLTEIGLVRRMSSRVNSSDALAPASSPPVRIEREAELEFLQRERRVSSLGDEGRASLDAIISYSPQANAVFPSAPSNPAALARARAAKSTSGTFLVPELRRVSSTKGGWEEGARAAAMTPGVFKKIPSRGSAQDTMFDLEGVAAEGEAAGQEAEGEARRLKEEVEGLKQTVASLQAQLHAAQAALREATERTKAAEARAEAAEGRAGRMADEAALHSQQVQSVERQLEAARERSASMEEAAGDAIQQAKEREAELEAVRSREKKLEVLALSAQQRALVAEQPVRTEAPAKGRQEAAAAVSDGGAEKALPAPAGAVYTLRHMLARNKLAVLAARWRAVAGVRGAAREEERRREAAAKERLEAMLWEHTLLRMKLGLKSVRS
ncbi:hypothetical protein AB1Y20_008643 [Prymnesium parvum]|uniref:Uncharacterized protein n=1 Tax=Prymnesium parvum TaxID=97485 RepID=A0AB34ITU3_PRYPA